VTLEEQTIRITNQVHHIERMLQEAVAVEPAWLLVVGHYPVFSAGEHGDTDELLTYLLPLIKKYNVSAYISGHDHISEHLT
jgi:tartrate-resistant acid phosphatase type 5